MEAKITKLFFASVLLTFLLAGFASAAVAFVEVSGGTQSVNPGETATVSFKLEEGNYGNFTEMVFNTPLTLTFGSETFDSKSSVTGMVTSLTKDQISGVMALDFVVPSDQASGDYTGNLVLTGKYATTVSYTLPLTITINENPSVSMGDDVTIPAGDEDTTITVTNDGNMPLTGIVLTSSGDFNVDLSQTTAFDLAVGGHKDVVVTITDVDGLDLGTNQVTLTATPNEGDSDSVKISTEGDYCDYSNEANLQVEIRDINVENGFGKDDGYWYLFDEIEVEVRVEPGKWDIANIEVEWILYTTSGIEIMDGGESDFDLDENDNDETLAFTIKLDENVEDFEGENAVLYVKATGKIDDSNADESDGDKVCVKDSQEVDVRTDEDFVILDDIKLGTSGTSAFCGESVQLTADVWNIGDNKQKDVSIRITNTELGIKEAIEIDDIKAFDKENLALNIQIPKNAEAKQYFLDFAIYDDGDIYENEENDEARFSLLITVEGACDGTSSDKSVIISAAVESGGKQGEELTVKASITNTGDELVSLRLSASDYMSWADGSEASPSTIIVSAGESKEVLFTFSVLDDIEDGDYSFNIDVVSGTDLVATQPVVVSIGKEGGKSNITGGVISGDNWYLWGIGLLNVILVVVIILVAVRLARK